LVAGGSATIPLANAYFAKEAANFRKGEAARLAKKNDFTQKKPPFAK
jgi:hypothetical protein